MSRPATAIAVRRRRGWPAGPTGRSGPRWWRCRWPTTRTGCGRPGPRRSARADLAATAPPDSRTAGTWTPAWAVKPGDDTRQDVDTSAMASAPRRLAEPAGPVPAHLIAGHCRL